MFELIRNWMMLCGATLIGYDMLKYVAYIGDSLEGGGAAFSRLSADMRDSGAWRSFSVGNGKAECI